MKYLQDLWKSEYIFLPINQQDQNHRSTLKEKSNLIEQAKDEETGL